MDRYDKLLRIILRIMITLALIIMAFDIILRIQIFPAEYVSKNDYLFIVILGFSSYLTAKWDMKKMKKIALAGLALSVINKFGFMIASILLW